MLPRTFGEVSRDGERGSGRGGVGLVVAMAAPVGGCGEPSTVRRPRRRGVGAFGDGGESELRG